MPLEPVLHPVKHGHDRGALALQAGPRTERGLPAGQKRSYHPESGRFSFERHEANRCEDQEPEACRLSAQVSQ